MASWSSKKTLYMILGLAAGMLVVAIAACAGLLSWGTALVGELPRAQAAASKFLDDIEEGELDHAYDAAAPTFRARFSAKEFAALVKKHPVLRKQTNRAMTGMRIYQRPSGEQATIDYRVADDQKPLSLVISVMKIGGQWRIANFIVR